MTKFKPHYDLPKVQALIRADRLVMVTTARNTAFGLGFNLARIKDALLSIRQTDFSKSAQDWQFKGHWQDAYKPHYDGMNLYVKWKIVDTGGEQLLILSFKEDEGVSL